MDAFRVAPNDVEEMYVVNDTMARKVPFGLRRPRLASRTPTYQPARLPP